MTHHLGSEKRSRNMSRIRGKDTPLEIVVKRNIPVFRRRFLSLMVTMQKGWLGRMGSEGLVFYREHESLMRALRGIVLVASERVLV